jgi:undecaprenyl diphosphate synthase
MIDTTPNHIAIIMDGNGTWAEKQNLPRLQGHKKGVEALKTTIDNIRKAGIQYMTVYAFSTENWNRSKQEVDGLMNMLRDYLQSDDIKKLNDENVRIRMLGNKNDSRIPSDILDLIKNVEETTENNSDFNFNIAFNYGGRDEIINTIKNIPLEKIKDLTEADFTSYLYTKGCPDPDLIIRTSGQQRISNFLLWQSAYSEFIFIDTLWPDFNKEVLDNCLREYSNRKRKFGKV